MTISGLGPATAALTPSWGGGVKPQAPGPEAEFMKWAKMTPGERMRANLLSSMGLTEEKVAAMSQEDRQKLEQKIREMIEEKITKGDSKPGLLVDQKA